MVPGFPDFLLHIDSTLPAMTETYGFWIYLVFFILILCETGVIVTPFLPGDSLVFVAGMVAAQGSLNISWLIATFLVAGIAGGRTQLLDRETPWSARGPAEISGTCEKKVHLPDLWFF